MNRNAKVSAIVDVFDSNAILLYLAEREKRFMFPQNERLKKK